MWIFTETGFLSIVQNEKNADYLLVRARKRRDLDLFLPMGTGIQIKETPDHDYRFRAVVPRDLVVQLVADAVADIFYTNFKNRVHDVDLDPDRSGAYQHVWSIMQQFQQRSVKPAPKSTATQVWYGDKPLQKKAKMTNVKGNRKRRRR